MKDIDVRHLINGKMVCGEGTEIRVINPSDETQITCFKGASKKQALEALNAADEAFKKWSALSISEREKHILSFADAIKRHKDEIIDVLIKETGKPYVTAIYDYNMINDCLHFFDEERKRLNDTIIPDYEDKHLSMVIKKPVGVVVGYLAWNFPLLNLGYKLGPILASGCTCVLKPSSNTPLASLMIGQAAKEAGIPDGVINIIAGSSGEIACAMNESTIPSMITLIGSSETGCNIIRESATSIKHYSLELGGSAPVIVMKDADVAAAGRMTADGKFGNCGQVCVAPNRIFVHESKKDEFIKAVLEYVDVIVLGSGKDEGEVLMGPLINERALKNMQELVKDAVDKGAKVVCGGKRADRAGWFFEPTVLDNVTKEMRVYNEEIFGPIMPILTFGDGDNVSSLANDTKYGLAAYLYTKDISAAIEVSRKIDSGNVCVNEPFYNFNLPHGGCKQSGVGKDCSRISLEEYFYDQRITIKR